MAASGTGGHLYPAQAVAKELIERGCNVVFMGYNLTTSPFFARDRFCYEEVASATFSRKNFIKAPFLLLLGIWQSMRSFYRHRPKLVVGFGSYHSFPVLVAAWLMKIPYILFEANAILGKVNRLFAKKAMLNTCELFDIKNPPAFFLKTTLPKAKERVAKISQEKALQYFGLQNALPTILIFGGSQGSVSMNHLAIEAVTEVKAKGIHLQVIHLLGSLMQAEEVLQRYEKEKIPAAVKAYESHMAQAYGAADFLICRAGASTVIEQMHHGVPALFIPYPYLKDDHQMWNARYVVDQWQGAMVISQKNLTKESLATHIMTMLEKSQSMKESLAKADCISTDKALVDVIMEKMS